MHPLLSSRVPGFRPLISIGAAIALTWATTACRSKPQEATPLATPTITLNHDRAPLGSPLEITYKFVPAPGATFPEEYRVFVHVVDADEELMWTDDHNPPTPTTQWKPGQPVEYTRTIFVPVYPYVGEATIQVGLHSTKDQHRLALAGEDAGQHSYKVARLQLAPQTDNIFTVKKDGWHPAEIVEGNAGIQWNWTKKEATLAFKNPKEDCVLYLELDNPGGIYNDEQKVSVRMNGQSLEELSVTPKQPPGLHRIALPGAALGTGDMAEIHFVVDKTFVPMQLSPSSKDPRELGVRIFHAFVARAH
jgi:hypothetical protein